MISKQGVCLNKPQTLGYESTPYFTLLLADDIGYAFGPPCSHLFQQFNREGFKTSDNEPSHFCFSSYSFLLAAPLCSQELWK